MNPKLDLRRVARCILLLTMLLRGYGLLNAQVVVTPDEKAEPGYRAAASVTSGPARSADRVQAPTSLR